MQETHETPQDQPHSAQTITTSGLPPRRLRHAQKPPRFSLSDRRVVIGGFAVAFLLLIGIVIGVMQALSQTTSNTAELPPNEQSSKQVATALPPAADREGKEQSTITGSVSPDSSALEAPLTAADVVPADAAPTPEADAVPQQQTSPSSPNQPSAERPVQTEEPTSAPTGKPQADVSGSSSTPPQSKEKAASQVIKHTVKKGDTLFALSRRYYGNNQGWKRIAQYNGLNPDEPLPIGKVLSIPTH